MYGDTGKLPALFLDIGIQGRAADDHPVSLDDHIVLNLQLKQLSRAVDKDAGILHGLDKLHEASYVADSGLADLLGTVLYYLSSDTVSGEELLQQRAVIGVAHKVRSRNSAAAGRDCGPEVAGGT